MSLYHYPEIYAALLYPEPDLLEDLLQWIEDYLDGPLDRVMDPACGPGTWLLPFAVRDVFTGGNDIQPAMVEEARRRLHRHPCEIIRGDMRRLAFETGPFDVAVNLHASVGHLPHERAIVQHLKSVAAHLRPGGLYFLGIVVFDGSVADEEIKVLYESDPTLLPSGGSAAVRYESVRRDPVRCEETIRLLLLTHGVEGCPDQLEEQYVLRTLTESRLRKVLKQVGAFDLLAVHAMDVDGHPDVGLFADCGDVTLALRRRE